LAKSVAPKKRKTVTDETAVAKAAPAKKPAAKKAPAKPVAAKAAVVKKAAPKSAASKTPVKAAAKKAAPKKKVAASAGLEKTSDTSLTLKLVLARLDDMKAEETVTIDLRGKSAYSDYMVVTSGRSNRHVGAVAENLAKGLKESGIKKIHVEGLPNCDWVLIDSGDVIVHVFRPEVREFYNLERLWTQSPNEEAKIELKAV
jgi:ribosome-associated protein